MKDSPKLLSVDRLPLAMLFWSLSGCQRENPEIIKVIRTHCSKIVKLKSVVLAFNMQYVCYDEHNLQIAVFCKVTLAEHIIKGYYP